MHIGMVGLGKMGMNMTRRLLNGGHKVTAFARTASTVNEAVSFGALPSKSLKELASTLPCPRVVWLMVPSGAATDEAIEGLMPHLSKGDILVDGGNTYYKDDLRRSESLKSRGIRHVDSGTSGGIWGLEKGYCLMVGGEKSDYEYLEPLFKTLAGQGGLLYCGPSGAGHFIKMIHNGIEYGLMEAYAEGFEIIKASPYADEVKMSSIAGLWMNGSVVRSWLLELMELAFKKDENLSKIRGYVEDSGEGRWTVKEAVDLGVSAPVITASLQRRFRSRQEDSFGERILAALRAEFGGHAVKYKP
ncbi:MAG TPA: decarboxylating 6-phosphogluconate dehydrogenase [Thermodesulfobacteriota bacterium]|nr:decarboxylating 6-phosphogluconate dehydrogenase [Thermodesulfobacteriota bacterium]